MADTQAFEEDHPPFCEMVYETIYNIPPGKVTTYGAIAKNLGYPGYARRVANCLSSLKKNLPKDLRAHYKELPWHRVIRSDMKIAFPSNTSKYHLQRKKLMQEGIIFRQSMKQKSVPIPKKYLYVLREENYPE